VTLLANARRQADRILVCPRSPQGGSATQRYIGELVTPYEFWRTMEDPLNKPVVSNGGITIEDTVATERKA
jgi:hypothetical protein